EGERTPRERELPADEHREEPPDDEHEEAVRHVLDADYLVIERKDVLAPERSGGGVDSVRVRDGDGFTHYFDSVLFSAAVSASHFWKSSGVSTVRYPFIR